MEEKIMSLMEDKSTPEFFVFSVKCELCKKVYESSPAAFSKRREIPQTEGKKVIHQVIYEREKAQAKIRAAKELMKLFSICPVCKKPVCDKCFMICDDIDICTDCAKKLCESGIIVEK